MNHFTWTTPLDWITWPSKTIWTSSYELLYFIWSEVLHYFNYSREVAQLKKFMRICSSQLGEKNADPPLGSILDIFEFENILMAEDPPD